MKQLITILLSLIIYSCNPSVEIKEEPQNDVIEKKVNEPKFLSKEDSIKKEKRKVYYERKKKSDELNKKGIREKSRTKILAQKNGKFPTCSYSKVILYKLNGNANDSWSEAVFSKRTGEYKELTSEQVKDFLALLNNKKSFGNSTAACHDPRIGLVFYDENEAPCSYLSLCLSCNNIYTAPKLKYSSEDNKGFSIKSRKKLHTIFEEWGFPDENYSFLFDDFELFKKDKEKEGLSDKEIKDWWHSLHTE